MKILLIFYNPWFCTELYEKHYPARVIGFEEDSDFEYLMEEFWR